MQQFINAAYQTKGVWDNEFIKSFHKDCLRDHDEIGLHIHLEKLVEKVELASKIAHVYLMMRQI